MVATDANELYLCLQSLLLLPTLRHHTGATHSPLLRAAATFAAAATADAAAAADDDADAAAVLAPAIEQQAVMNGCN